MDPSIRILHVDDDPGFLEVTADLLSAEDGRFDVSGTTSPEDGLVMLDEQSFDCVVSDYDMSECDGIAFLETVRERYGDLPFILFTGKGSEEVASDAITAGVTDYLQKAGTVDQYALLANRIDNAVTARRANRDSKRRMQEYETLIESAPVPMAVVDDDGSILYLNESAQETLAVQDTRSVNGASMMKFIHPDDRPKRRESIERAATHREATESREYRLASGEDEEKMVRGSVVPVTFDGEPAAQLVFVDITAQRKREAELRDLMQFRETVIENANVWLTVLDSDGEVVIWNRAAAEISGYGSEEMMGSDSWKEKLYPDEEYRETVIVDIGDVLRDGGSIEGYESTITTADGEKRRIYWDAHPLSGVSDEYDGVISVGWDITEQHERTQELKTLHQGTRALMDAADRETVADLTANVAEEILGYEYTAVRFVDEAEEVLEPTTVTKGVSETLGDRPTYPLDGESPHAQVYETGELLSFDDVREVGDDYNREPVRSAMYLPMGDHGMVTICDPEEGAFDQSDIELASILLANAEAALDRLDREQEITRVTEQLQAFLQGTTDLITLIERDGTIKYLSPAVEWMLGYGQEELVGESAFDYIHPHDVERVRKRFLAGIERGGSTKQSTEFRFRHADGPWVWVESQTRVQQQESLEGYVVTSREINERKEQEEQLKREHERFSALFENFPEPTLSYRYEAEEPFVVSVNQAFEATFGYDYEDAVDEPIDDLVVPDEKQEEADQLDRRVKQGELLDQQVRRKTADCEREFNFRNIPYPKGEHIDGFAVYNDINKRVERERELQRQNERLDEFAGIVAHDLRNPLNVAQARTELATRECDSEHLQDVRNAHDRMEALLEETLILARQGEMVSEPETVRIDGVVENCHEMVTDGESTVIVEDDVAIRCDRDRIRQLFENLISNAIEHGKEDVTVRIGVTGGDCLYVEDDGPGIEMEDTDQIFEPGYTTDTEGTGFGLAIISRIVEAHDWEISVTESAEGGARFEIDGITVEATPTERTE